MTRCTVAADDSRRERHIATVVMVEDAKAIAIMAVIPAQAAKAYESLSTKCFEESFVLAAATVLISTLAMLMLASAISTESGMMDDGETTNYNKDQRERASQRRAT